MLLRILFIFIFTVIFNTPVYALDGVGQATYTINIPKGIKIEGIGVVDEFTTNGIPSNEDAGFSRMVKDSYSGNSWQLTTDKPIGVSVSYNQSGYIDAKFIHLMRQDGFMLTDVYIYPSKVFFDTSSNVNNIQRIFRFYPIIRVSKNTPPGSYTGKIMFTVMGQ